MTRKERFTPGPWEVIVNDPWQDHDFGMVRNLSIVAPAGSTIIGPIADTPSRFKEFEEADMPNANLIASAPELYEALCSAREWMELLKHFADTHDPDEYDIAAIIRKYEAVLAKARGLA